MANNYKAQFCKQQFFIDLRDSFLKRFSLRQKNGSLGNDLGMGFLLHAYDLHNFDIVPEEKLEEEKRKIQNRRNNCYWELGKVTSEDVMFAIEEFFWITSRNSKLLKQQTTLMECLLNPEDILDPKKYIILNTDKYLHAEDITLNAILRHYGVIRENEGKLDIGTQIIRLSNFLRSATKIYEGYDKEVRYLNALYLYRELRNLQVHELEIYDGQKKIRYHEFILFTYIGLCYLCRKLWQTEETAMYLFAEGNSPTKEFQEFQMPEEEISVQIDTCNDEIITSCSYTCGNKSPIEVKANLPNGHLEFKMKVRRFEEFQIRVSCNGQKIEPPISKTLKYNDWNLALLIMLPPVDDKYHCLDIAGENTKINVLVDEIVNRIKDEFEEDIQDALMLAVGNFEPLFQKAKVHDNEVLNYDILKAIKDVDDSLAYVSDQIDKIEENVPIDRLNDACKVVISEEINKINCTIEKLYKKHLGIEMNLLNALDEKVESLIEITGKTELKVDTVLSNQEKEKQERIKEREKKEKTKLQHKVIIEKTKRIVSYIPLCLAIFVFGAFLLTDWSLFTPILSLYCTLSGCVTFTIVLTSFSVLLFAIAEKGIKRIGRWEWGLSFLTFLLLILSKFLIPIRIKNYSFIRHSGDNNTIAINFMERYLESEPSNDEYVRTQLATYYLIFANQPEKAIQLTASMIKNIEKYPKGSIVLAEAYYEQKNEENYSLIKRIIERYKEKIGDSIPAIVRLEGILTAYGEGGFDNNISRADSLLKYAADSGDIEAQYLFGHLLSNYIEKCKMNITQNSVLFQIAQYDLYSAIWYLRKASEELPKAAIELGDIYSDLNLKDSAAYYYKKAIEPAVDILKGEALYKLGILQDNVKNDYLIDAAYKYGYKPAILRLAMCDNSHTEIIKYYKKYGYQGSYYIHPLAFEFVSIGELEKAYEVLRDSLPEGHFDMNFVKGMECIMSEGGDIQAKGMNSKGMDYICESAHNGCLFAEMMCIYLSLQDKKTISHSDIERLIVIGKVIPFANLLLSQIYKFTGYYLWADIFALEASVLKHPSVGKILSMKGPGEYGINSFMHIMDTFTEFDKKGIRKYKDKGSYKEDDIRFLKFECNLQNIELRMSPYKSTSLTLAYKMDKILWHIYHHTNYPLDRLQFWSNIAIANHEYFNECQLLMEYVDYSELKGNNLDYIAVDTPNMQRLVDAAIRDYIGGDNLEQCRNILIRAINVIYKSTPNYVDSLQNIYKDDKNRISLFTGSKAFKFKDGINHTLSTWLNPDDLLTELSSYFENTLFINIESLTPVEN